MVKVLSSAAAAGLIVLALGASGASATPTIANFSFESPGTTSFAAGCPSGWTCNGTQVGVYDPNNTQFPGVSNGLPFVSPPYAPDGVDAAVTYSLTAQYMEQTNVDTIQANTKYTLSVWLGAREDMQDAWSVGGETPTIELLANSTVIASPSAVTITTDPGASGVWKQFSVIWDSASLPADVGMALGIELLVPTNTHGDQVAWDDVTLTEVADSACTAGVACNPNGGSVPEPFTLSLFGAGLAGAATLRRRRKV